MNILDRAYFCEPEECIQWRSESPPCGSLRFSNVDFSLPSCFSRCMCIASSVPLDSSASYRDEVIPMLPGSIQRRRLFHARMSRPVVFYKSQRDCRVMHDPVDRHYVSGRLGLSFAVDSP